MLITFSLGSASIFEILYYYLNSKKIKITINNIYDFILIVLSLYVFFVVQVMV